MSTYAFSFRLTAVLLLAAGLFCLSPSALGQNNNSPSGVNQGGSPVIHQQAGLNPDPQQGNPDSSASQIDQMRQAERTRRIAADTAKLVQLSSELKAEIDKSPNQLSVLALRKATEIEKTAHDLKGWITY
ncbi:MAG TPA: hypothetical protein VGM11_09090 [Acidobacteriaceae bacterium]